MTLFKTLVALVLVGGLSACGGADPVTRGPSAADAPLVPLEISGQAASWNVVDVRVNVPSTLKVSEANRYYPIADIVWREDPFGDRYAQVASIMDAGLTAGLTHLKGDRPVYFDITVSRFHSLTEKARYSVGGVHNMIFTLTVVDAASGQALHGPVKIELDLKAYGGSQAFAAERRGHTQKVRINSHLTNTMKRQFGGIVAQLPAADGAVQVSRAAYSPLVPTGYEPARR